MNDKNLNGTQESHPDETDIQPAPPTSQPDIPQPVNQSHHPTPSPQGSPPYFAPKPPKDRSVAIILEILPGLFGILGIGWIYAENTAIGILILVLYLLWNAFAIILDVLLGGFFLCIHIPINLTCLILSPVLLSNYTKQHQELFGP